MNYRLEQAGASQKILFTCFLLFVGIGYLMGIANIHNNTGFSYTGLVVHYRGDTQQEVPQDLAITKLVHHNHVHLFSLSMLFLLVGTIFSFTSLPEKAKCLFMPAPFLGMLVDFSSFWLIVLKAPFFAWISIIFGAFMAVSFFLLIGRPIYEMWIVPVWRKKWGESIPWFLR